MKLITNIDLNWIGLPCEDSKFATFNYNNSNYIAMVGINATINPPVQFFLRIIKNATLGTYWDVYGEKYKYCGYNEGTTIYGCYFPIVDYNYIEKVISEIVCNYNPCHNYNLKW